MKATARVVLEGGPTPLTMVMSNSDEEIEEILRWKFSGNGGADMWHDVPTYSREELKQARSPTLPDEPPFTAPPTRGSQDRPLDPSGIQFARDALPAEPPSSDNSPYAQGVRAARELWAEHKETARQREVRDQANPEMASRMVELDRQHDIGLLCNELSLCRDTIQKTRARTRAPPRTPTPESLPDLDSPSALADEREAEEYLCGLFKSS